MYQVFAGTNSVRGSKGIYTLSLSDTGKAEIIHTVQAYNTGYVALGGDRLFAVSEGMTFKGKASGGVMVYDISADGSLKLIDGRATDGQRPCCLCASADGHETLVSNFYGGLLHAYPVTDQGRIENARLTIDEENTVLPIRALHCTGFLPGEKIFGVVSLGRMSMLLYDHDSGRLLSEYSPGPGRHPRHFAASPDGRFLYLLMQDPAEIHVLSVDHGKMEYLQTFVLSEEKLVFGSSAVRVSPDGKFVSAAHRENNTIYTMEIQQDGRLERCSETVLPGNVPRDFAFTPDGKFVISALQYSDQISIHAFQNGHLQLTDVIDHIPSPASIVSREVPSNDN